MFYVHGKAELSLVKTQRARPMTAIGSMVCPVAEEFEGNIEESIGGLNQYESINQKRENTNYRRTKHGDLLDFATMFRWTNGINYETWGI